MKILTTYIASDEGSAAVNGTTLTLNQGGAAIYCYLPEHNPLYLDLRARISSFQC
jgi:ABC-2 type transport system ATP-binding protein